MGFGGYEPPTPPDTVQIAVPTELAESVAEFVTNPEGFLAALEPVESTLRACLVEIESGTWVDPSQVAGITVGFGFSEVVGSRVYLKGGGFIETESSPGDLVDVMRQKLSQVYDRINGTNEGAPA